MSFFGAMNMLGLAKRVNARILQASTSEVTPRFVVPQLKQGERAMRTVAYQS